MLTQYSKQYRYNFFLHNWHSRLSERSYFTRNFFSYVINVSDWEHSELSFTFVHNIL